MKASILFLVTAAGEPHDNAQRLPQCFSAAGWDVSVRPHDAVESRFGEVCVDDRAIATYDLLWPIGFGPRNTFLDRAQLLDGLDGPNERIITPLRAQLRLHGKSAWLEYCAPSAVSAAPATLCAMVDELGGTWVLKPCAASFGEGVELIERASQVARCMRRREGYWILQRYVPEIVSGEIRTLVCGSEILGSYRRVPAPGRLTANLATSARAEPVTLTAREVELISRVHARLQMHEVGYAAIDTCADVLMEVNIANPGGLSTLERLYGTDLGPSLVRAATNLLARRAGERVRASHRPL